MKQDVIDSISKMVVSGNRMELPQNEHFTNYAQVKKALTQAGGKYKKNGFDFTSCANTIKLRLTGGEVINDKKKFQFFATPTKLVDQLIEIADITENCKTLEPSAGQGAISDRLASDGLSCTMVELMPENAEILRNKGYGANDKGYKVIEKDFLSVDDIGSFDKIVANPPFTKNQDIDHIKKMYTHLNDGGTLVSIASKSWTFGSQKKQIAFREWLDEVDGEVTEVSEGAFKESGTNVATVIIKIDKVC